MGTGIYGFSPERWKYIWKNVDFSKDTEMQDKLGEFFDIKKPFRRGRKSEKTSKTKPLRVCNCSNPLEKGKQLCTKCRRTNRRKTKSAYYKKIVGSD